MFIIITDLDVVQHIPLNQVKLLYLNIILKSTVFYIVGKKFTDVSEEGTAFMFRAEE
jgi:hypothetical protein